MSTLNQDAERIIQTAGGRSDASSTLRKDFGWTLFGNGIYAASQWAVLILLAKMGSPELVGHYSFAVAVATPVMAFAGLQLRSVQVTDVKDQHSFGDYLGFRIWTVLTAVALLTGICLMMRYPLQSTLLTEIIGLALAIETLSDLYYGIMQIHGHMDRIAKSMIARGLLSLAFMSIVLETTRSLVFAVIALAGARLLIALVYDMRLGIRGLPSSHTGSINARAQGPVWNPRSQINLLGLALPIGVVALLVSLNTSIPRYFIQWALGARELGIFSALCFFSSSGNMISNALGQAAFARLATAYGNGQLRSFSLLLAKLLLVAGALGLAGVVGTWLWGQEILRILYKPEYAQRSSLLILLMGATALGYFAQFVGVAITSARSFTPQIPLFLVVGATLILTSYLLVPRAGLSGAIFAIAITNAIQLLGSGVVLFMVLRQGSLTDSFRIPLGDRESLGVANP